MTIQQPSPRPDPGASPTRKHAEHGSHELMMIACCLPMIGIAGLLVVTGIASPGLMVAALVCTAMMAGMVFLGHDHHR